MARRHAYLQQHDVDGLTLCPDGLRRLIVNRAGDAEAKKMPPPELTLPRTAEQIRLT